MGENTASDSDADLLHEHTLNCYLLDCPHERGIHTSVTNGDENTSKATDSNTVELLMDIEPYEITGDGYTFDADAGKLSNSNNDATIAWKNASWFCHSDCCYTARKCFGAEGYLEFQ